MLRKGVYPHEYMDEWEKITERALPEEEDFYSILNMVNITDADSMHAKRFCSDFERKMLVENYNFYVKIYTLLLTDVFQNFRKICLKIYHSDSVKFLSAPGLDWQAALKKRLK